MQIDIDRLIDFMDTSRYSWLYVHIFRIIG